METQAVSTNFDHNWNPTSRAQYASTIQLSGIQSSLFEQILSLPIQTNTPSNEPDSPEPPPESSPSIQDESTGQDSATSGEPTDEGQDSATADTSVALEASLQLVAFEVAPAINPETTEHQANLEGETVLEANLDVERPAGLDIDVADESDRPVPTPISPATTKESSNVTERKIRQESAKQETASYAQTAGEDAADNQPTAIDHQAPESELESAQEIGRPAVDAKPKASRRPKWFEPEGQSFVPDASSDSDSQRSNFGERPASGADTLISANASHSDQIALLEPRPHGPSQPDTPSPENSSVAGLDGNPAIGTNTQRTMSPVTEVETANRAIDETRTVEALKPSAPDKTGDKRSANATAQTGDVSKPGGISQQERVRLVQRIARSFNRLSPGGGQINLRLHPPHLGSLSVQVRLEGRDMAARLSTETAAAREAILESLPALRSRLAEQGFEISQFQVDVADNFSNASSSGRQSQTESGYRDRQQQSPANFRPLVTTTSSISTADLAGGPVRGWLTANSIDVHA